MICDVKMAIFAIFTRRCYNLQFINITTSGLSILMHGVISLPEATSCDKKRILHEWSFHMNFY